MSEELKTAVAEKPKTKNLITLLGDMKDQFALVLPKHLTPDRLVRIAITQLRINPDLKNSDPASFIAAIMTSAQLGLEPDGILGHAYLVPFNKKGKLLKQVQLIPGYKGLLTLARNSGEVQSISAHEVCKNDKFDFAYGLNERLEHIPAAGERGDITHFYAIAKFKDGSHHMDVMTVQEINKIRSTSKSSGSGSIWENHFVEMGKKTIIRRIAKYLPLNVQRAAALDNMYDAGNNVQIDKLGDFVIEGESQEIADAKQVEHKPANLAEFEATLEQSKPEPAEITIDEAKQKEFDAAFEKHKKEETKLSKLKKEPEQMGLVP